MDGTWISARPIPGTIVVNIGDLLQYWSGGRYRATPHRVRLTDERTMRATRNSIALFVHPNHDTDIRPFNGQEDKEESEVHGTTALDHVSRRFQETYLGN